MWWLLACTGAPGKDSDGDGVPDGEDCAPDDAGVGSPAAGFVDADGDGFGDPARTAAACPGEAGWSADGTDCDDGAATVYPGAPEIWYDGADEDCSGGSDFDQDGDGVDRGPDCNDEDATVPAPERCATDFDDDCDGEVNEVDAEGCTPGYPDLDGDGFGGEPAACRCEGGEGWAAASGDCDDADPYRFPDAPELCDDADNGCDGGWTPADEVGRVTSYDAEGRAADVTEGWASGTAASPATPPLPPDGLVRVCEGTWYVNLASEASVELHGLGEAVLEGAGGRILSLAGEGGPVVTLRDLTLRGGVAECGGAIHASGIELSLDGVVLEGNTGLDGGGALCVYDGSLSLRDTTLAQNAAPSCGAGYLYGPIVEIVGGAIEGNLADKPAGSYAGALAWFGTGRGGFSMDGVVVEDNAVSSARGDAWGGALYLYDAGDHARTITNSTFSGNSASSGGRGVLGAAVYLYAYGGGDFSFTENVVSDNVSAAVTDAYGGALTLFFDGAGTVEVGGNTVTGNELQTSGESAGGGLALSMSGEALVVAGNTWSSNRLLDGAGRAAGSGGGLSVTASGADFTWEGDRFEDNAAGAGGGAFLSPDLGTSTVMTDLTAVGNEGGAILYSPGGTTEQLWVEGGTFTENAGSGLWIYAVTGTRATVDMTSSSAGDPNLSDNHYGVALTCQDVGGSCELDATSLDFGLLTNLYCDAYVDGACFLALGDDVALSCTSGSTGTCSY